MNGNNELPTIHISYSHDDQIAFRRYFTDHLTPDAQKAVLDALDHLYLDGLLRGWDGRLIVSVDKKTDGS
jgi:hypothetical protein